MLEYLRSMLASVFVLILHPLRNRFDDSPWRPGARANRRRLRWPCGLSGSPLGGKRSGPIRQIRFDRRAGSDSGQRARDGRLALRQRPIRAGVRHRAALGLFARRGRCGGGCRLEQVSFQRHRAGKKFVSHRISSGRRSASSILAAPMTLRSLWRSRNGTFPAAQQPFLRAAERRRGLPP